MVKQIIQQCTCRFDLANNGHFSTHPVRFVILLIFTHSQLYPNVSVANSGRSGAGGHAWRQGTYF